MADPNSPELPPVVEARKAPRKRVILGGKVVYNEGGFSIDCRIRDLSAGGARIALTVGSIIPTRVVLIDTRSAIAYECEIVWLKAPEFGLKFLSRHSLRGQLPPQLSYLKGYA
jgi:hypothetical protein